MVITGRTRNFTAPWSFRPPEILDIKGFSKSKIEYFSVFSPAFLSKNFLSIKQTEIYTEGYRSGHNGADSKSVVRLIPDQGFESLTLRHRKACNQADCRLFSYVFFRKQVVRAYRIFCSPKFGLRHPPIGSRNHRFRAKQALFPLPVPR